MVTVDADGDVDPASWFEGQRPSYGERDIAHDNSRRWFEEFAEFLEHNVSLSGLDDATIDSTLYHVSGRLGFPGDLTRLEFNLKAKCILGIPRLCESAVRGRSAWLNSVFMFWEAPVLHLTSDPEVRELCLDALRVQLESPEGRCQESAIHALREFHAPDADTIVREFAGRSDRDPTALALARAAVSSPTWPAEPAHPGGDARSASR